MGAFMDALSLRKPGAWIPVAMSAAALAAVLVQLAVHGPAPEPDEGVVAHLWQLLMVGQMPLIAWFTAKWLRRSPQWAWPVLATQLAAAAAAGLPVALLGW
jgi:hypothetical protein